MARVYHWKHGWIPLDHVALKHGGHPTQATSPIKGASRAEKSAHHKHPDTGIQNRAELARAIHDLPNVPEADKPAARAEIRAAGRRLGATDLTTKAVKSGERVQKAQGRVSAAQERLDKANAAVAAHRAGPPSTRDTQIRQLQAAGSRQAATRNEAIRSAEHDYRLAVQMHGENSGIARDAAHHLREVQREDDIASRGSAHAITTTGQRVNTGIPASPRDNVLSAAGQRQIRQREQDATTTRNLARARPEDRFPDATRAHSYEPGEPVTYHGAGNAQHGEVVGHAGGFVRVKLANGRTVSADPGDLTRPTPAARHARASSEQAHEASRRANAADTPELHRLARTAHQVAARAAQTQADNKSAAEHKRLADAHQASAARTVRNPDGTTTYRGVTVKEHPDQFAAAERARQRNTEPLPGRNAFGRPIDTTPPASREGIADILKGKGRLDPADHALLSERRAKLTRTISGNGPAARNGSEQAAADIKAAQREQAAIGRRVRRHRDAIDAENRGTGASLSESRIRGDEKRNADRRAAAKDRDNQRREDRAAAARAGRASLDRVDSPAFQERNRQKVAARKATPTAAPQRLGSAGGMTAAERRARERQLAAGNPGSAAVDDNRVARRQARAADAVDTAREFSRDQRVINAIQTYLERKDLVGPGSETANVRDIMAQAGVDPLKVLRRFSARQAKRKAR